MTPVPPALDFLSQIFPGNPGDANYRINWSRKLRIIYVETPKVGCTLIKRTLQYCELDRDASRLPEDVHDRDQSPLLRPSDAEAEFVVTLGSDDYFKFSFVRSPITRLLSAYLDKIRGHTGPAAPRHKALGIDPLRHVPSFSEFVDILYDQDRAGMDVHWAPQTMLLALNEVRYDFLGRFEHFDASFEELLSKRNLVVPPGVRRDARAHATHASQLVREYYTPAILRRVQEIYEQDFKRLGYGWSL
jgi:hypothetical protein